MFAENPHREGHSNLPLRLISEIAHGLAVADTLDLDQVLSHVVQAAFQVSRLSEGTASLLDYAADSQYVVVAAQGEAPHLSRKEVITPSIAPQFPLAPSEDAEVLPVVKSDGGGFIRVPIVVGAHELGIIHLDSPRLELHLDGETISTLQTLASLAATAIDRKRRQQNATRLHTWFNVFGKLLAENRHPSQPDYRSRLLGSIAENARYASGADFVVLYEYVSEREDVIVPPTIAGLLRQRHIIEGRGLAHEHRKSVLFRLLQQDCPIFATHAPSEWADQGLARPESTEHDDSFFHREGVVSSAGLPLRFDEEIVGILFVNYRTGQIFSPEFRQYLELLASFAGLAIGNSRLADQSRRYAENMKALNEIGREFGSAVDRDIEQIGKLIHQRTRDIIPARNFMLCLYEAGQDVFTIPYAVDQFDTVEELQPILHGGLVASVCRTGQSLLATAEQQQSIFASGIATLVGTQSAAWMGAPLLVREEVIGAIVVQDYENSNAFTEEQKSVLTAIASQAAIAIDNYQLLRDARMRLRELEALLDISQAFGAGNKGLKELLASILEHVSEIANCDGGLILLIDPADSSKLKVTASSPGLSEYVGETLRVGEGASGCAVATGQPQILNDYNRHPNQALFFEPLPRNVCAIPLYWKGTAVGAMALSSSRELSQREIAILQRFAGSIAAAVQNSRDSSFRNALVHAGPNAIVAADRSGRIITFNEEAETLFKKEALVGQSVDLLYWEGHKEAQRIQWLLENHGKIRDQEIFGRSQDDQNEKIPISLSAALLKDDVGETVGSVGILQDLRLQSLRGRSKLLVEALVEISREEDLSKIAAVAAFSAAELLYAEAACLFLLEHDRFELTSVYRADPALAEGLKAEARRLNLLASRNPREVVFLPQQDFPEGLRLLPHSQSAVLVPIHTDERLLGYLLIESLEAEHFRFEREMIAILASQIAVWINRAQLLREREKTREGLLATANAVQVGQIVTSFIHETKNSLNTMSMTVYNLHEDISATDFRDKEDYLERLSVVSTEMQRLDQLSRRLQKFTRQGLRPEKHECYLNDVVTSTVQLLNGVLKGRQMRFEMRLDPSLERREKGKGRPIVVDQSQIQQTLMNLILNAVAASEKRSPLQVETRSYLDFAEVRIRDFGSGIRAEDQEHLFTPFFTTKPDGVGLGLYISQLMIVENHGGSIEFESVPGRGTLFVVRLPISPAKVT